MAKKGEDDITLNGKTLMQTHRNDPDIFFKCPECLHRAGGNHCILWPKAYFGRAPLRLTFPLTHALTVGKINCYRRQAATSKKHRLNWGEAGKESSRIAMYWGLLGKIEGPVPL